MTYDQPSLQSLRAAVGPACQPQNAWRIVRGREAVLAMPRSWTLEHVGAIAEEMLDLTDYWEYRRLLELLHLLDPTLVLHFASRGLASPDADVKEAAEDFHRSADA